MYENIFQVFTRPEAIVLAMAMTAAVVYLIVDAVRHALKI